MKQISDPTVIISTLKAARLPRDARGVPFVLYAPGDSTLYRVSLTTLWPSDPDSAIMPVPVLMVTVVHDIIVMPKPADPRVPWSAERFADKFGGTRIGWWPAVRPLLAVLRWTPESDRSTAFEPSSWLEMSKYA